MPTESENVQVIASTNRAAAATREAQATAALMAEQSAAVAYRALAAASEAASAAGVRDEIAQVLEAATRAAWKGFDLLMKHNKS